MVAIPKKISNNMDRVFALAFAILLLILVFQGFGG